MPNLESTAVFRANIASLKKEMQAASRAVKLADAEFRAATAGMDDWGSSADGLEAKLKQLNSTLSAQQKRYNSQKQVLENTIKAYGENSAAADRERTTLLNMEAQIKRTESQIKRYNEQLEEVNRATEDAADGTKEYKSASDELRDTIKDQESRLETLKKRYSDLALEQDDTSDESEELAQEIRTLSGELKDNKKRLEEAENAADEFDDTLDETDDSARDASDGFTVMKAALANLLADGIRRAIEGLKELAKQTLEAGMNFENGMAQVAAISGASGAELDALTAKAKEMGETTKFSATESADAFKYMAMAGWDTQDMIDGIAGIMNLAAASGADLATTSDIVTDALTAMGYSAGDAGRLADVMAAASSNANTNVELMGATFQYAAPIIGALGYNMEDAAVAIGLMANAGIKGQKAGTALRSILTRLSAPPAEAASAMDALGISLTNTDGTMRSMDDVMQDLRGAFDDLSETQQTQYAKSIAGAEAMSGLLSIVNAAPADYAKLTEAVQTADGAAQGMADTMNDTLGGQLTLLRSKIEGIQIQIYEKAAPQIRKGIEKISQALDKVNWGKVGDAVGKAFEKLVDVFAWIIDHGQQIIAVLKTIATVFITYALVNTITKVVGAFRSLVGAVQSGTGAMQAFTAATNLNPITLLISALAGLTVGIIELAKQSIAAMQAEYGLTDAQQAAVDKANALKSEYDDMISARQTALSGIDAEYDRLQDLADEYTTLIDANGNVKRGYEDRAAFITSTLADALGMEQDEVAELIQKNVDLADSIDNVIQKKQAEASLMALESDYTTAVQKRQEALETYTGAQQAANEAQQHYAEVHAEAAAVMQEYNKLLQEDTRAAQVYYDQNQEIIDGEQIAADAYREAVAAMNGAEEAYVGYNATIENYEGLSSAIISGDSEKIQAALQRAQSGFVTAATGTERTLQQQVRTLEEQYRQMERAVAEGMPGVTQEQVDAARDLVEQARAELNKLSNAGKEGGESLQTGLVEGITEGAHAVPPAIEELTDAANFADLQRKAEAAGITVPEYLAQSIADGSLSITDAIAQMTQLASFADLLSASEAAGTQVPDYITQGILDGSLSVQDAVAQMVTLANFNTLVQKAEEAGITIPEELKEGIAGGNGNVVTAISQLIGLVNKELETGKTGAGEAGKNYTIGYSDGILSLIDTATGAAVSLGEASLTALSEEIEEGSPSRATRESGTNFTLGFAEGIEDEEGTASEAAQSMADTALDALDGAENRAKQSGQRSGRGYASGLSGAKSEAEKSGRTVAESGTRGAQAGSTGTNAAGATAGQQYSAGIRAQGSGAYSAGTSIATQAKSGAQSVDVSESGKNFTQGFINGMGSLIQNVIQKAREVAGTALTALRKRQQEGSPSKLTYQSGVFFTQGYINGIASQQKNLVNVVKRLVTSTAAVLSKSAAGEYAKAGATASKAFADSMSAQTSYVLSRVQFQNDYKLKQFDADITKLQNELNAKTKLQKEVDNARKRITTLNKKESLSEAEKTEIKSLQKTVANGTKKLKTTYNKNYGSLISALQKNKEAYQSASAAMLQQFSAAMNNYAAQAQELIDSTINGITDKYTDRYNELINRQDELVSKLKNAGDLFTISGAGVITVNDIKEQTKAITDYTDKLTKIKSKVSEDLFNQILSYDMTEGSAFLDQLLSMSENDLTAYSDAYTEKMQAARKAGDNLFKADFKNLGTEYKSAINKAFADLPGQLEALGKQSMQGFVNGLTKNTDYMSESVKTFVKGMVNTFKKELKIKSPSRVMYGLGEFTGEGFDNGLLSMLKSVQKTAQSIAQAVTQPLTGISGDLSGIRSAVAQGTRTGMYGASGAGQTVNNYNLVQNNNSPKALSALETYQARRQQIALVKAFA